MTTPRSHQVADAIRTQATALGLAVIVTFSLLAAVLQIANAESDSAETAALLASTAAHPAQAVQTIVIVGKRQAQV